MITAAQQANNLLRQITYYHLDNLAYDNALFFAERLCAQDKSAESVYLLALCHLRLDDNRSAYEVSKPLGYGGAHLGCAFVFAQACARLERWRDGILALEKSRGLWSQSNNLSKHSDVARVPLPDGAACSCLLGKLYRRHDDKKRAVACYEDALKMNPTTWDAFTSLCDMGVAVTVPNIFRINTALLRTFDPESANAHAELSLSQQEARATRGANRLNAQDTGLFFDRPAPDASIFSRQGVERGKDDLASKIVAAKSRYYLDSANHGPGMNGSQPQNDSQSQRAASILSDGQPALVSKRRPAAAVADPVIKVGIRRREKPDVGDQIGDWRVPVPKPSTTSLTAGDKKRTVSGLPVNAKKESIEELGGPQRRSARLNLFKNPTAKAPPISATTTTTDNPPRELRKARAPISRLTRPGIVGSTVGRVVSGNRTRTDDGRMDVDQGDDGPPKEKIAVARMLQRIPTPEVGSVQIEDSLRIILDLLRKLATGYQQLTRFQCKEAHQTFLSLHRMQQDSPWVLAQMGRAQYEQAAYGEAEKHFRRLRLLAPARLQDMEMYSTVLWHLRRETDLSFLAHELVDSSWHSPQAWCTLGNAWSLVSDHEQALKCFRRATQLAPEFAYAYTLQGHEHVANEEYDMALTAYRQAVAVDRRHYNGYYGIGRVYEKLGSYDKAQAHYETASRINPTNAVLVCCIGTVYEKQGDLDLALEYFGRATELAPKAAQTRFRKARALLAKGLLREAQMELVIIKDLAPDDARVHFLLGKLYKSSGEKGHAIRHFTQALSLDPKASQLVKVAIESIEDDAGLDNSMMD